MKNKKNIFYDNQWKRDLEKEASKFSQLFMSNSKWVKLIDKLVENNHIIQKIFFKKIQNENRGELYLADDPSFGFEYWHSGFELNNSLGQPLAFNEIEYLSFPKIIAHNTTQNLQKISEIIQSAGEFYLESDEDELKLICYKK
ncbi:MAG: hypothetical protein MUW56_06365 [Chryseobacterium sp.]|uniref:hypothetical protein n=1 Tax=Chryseobacterium sp. TaxID=1871047 RepID=UPI0025BBA412|nr:hypothetical protein [Chryseobacterium sp.]MCJ7933258.1 hypothetical protein [Chryseobacterium sp.]